MEFSLNLNEDQIQLQKWVHDFAVDVIRPNAEEWDEREEFPYPIVEQAQEIGLYGWEFMAEGMMNDPTGLTIPTAPLYYYYRMLLSAGEASGRRGRGAGGPRRHSTKVCTIRHP